MQNALTDKQMLIVLDNFEQVVEAAPLLADLLALTPQIKILVTSRSSLHLRGEKLFNIPPLALPNPKELPPLEELARIESVALFVERTQDAIGAFNLTPENAPLVAQICAQLDGLPLAIELAAARMRLMSLSALYAKLERQPGQENQSGQLGLLTGGPRDAPTQHQALRRAIESSYSLLNSAEQKLFRRLGIFVGSFTYDAAEAVAGATLDSLETVLDQSLVRRQPPSERDLEGETRFSMLASIREYAQESMVANNELEEVSHKHARYLLNLIVTTKDQAEGSNEQSWAATTGAWLSDFRSAMRWAIKGGEGEIALGMAAELHMFWKYGRQAEGGRWVEEALAVSGDVSETVRVQGLQVASLIAQGQSDYAKSRIYSQQSLPLYRKLGDKRGMAVAFSALGVVAAEEEDYEQALALFEQSLASWRELGNTYNAAILLLNMSFLAIRMKDYDRAIRLSQESADAFSTIGNTAGVTRARISIGIALLHKRDYEHSIELHTECAALMTELGNMRDVSLANNYIGLALLAQGNYIEAAQHYRKSLAISQETSNRFGTLRALLGLAGAELGHDHAQRAVRMVSAVNVCGFDATKNSVPAEGDLQERIIAGAREILTEMEFAAAWTVGQGMSLEEAVQFASQA